MSNPITTQSFTCKSCFAILPTSAFGAVRYKKSGYQDECRECRNQIGRLHGVKTKGFRPRRIEPLIRNVRIHNVNILSNLLTSPTGLDGLSVVAIGYADRKDYHIKFLKHSVHVYYNDLIIFEMTNTVSTKPEILESYVDMFKLLKLRLELNELQALLSKRSIFMWEGF